MRCRWLFAIALLVLLGLGLGPVRAEDGEARVQLLVPAYFYPGGGGREEWERMFTSPARADTIAIVNPASGPGKAVDPHYTAVLKRAEETGVTPIGYITTSYAKRPIADVKAEVDRWLVLYPGIRGLFFDEQASADEQVAYYGELYDYARKGKRLKLVVTNPGTVCSERYFSRPAADVICLFEGPLAPRSLRLPTWTGHYPPRRIAALPYQTGTAEAFRGCLRDAVAHGIGTLYITDSGEAMPWGRLPGYWDAESAAVRDLNRTPPRPTTPGPRP